MSRFVLDISDEGSSCFSNDMDKAAEIKVIEKLQRIYKSYPDNYLASLFSDTFAGWATKQIQDDMVCSLDKFLNGDFAWGQDNQFRILEKKIVDKDLKIEQLRRELKDAASLLEITCESAEKEIKLQEEQLEKAEDAIDDLGMDIDLLQRQMTDLITIGSEKYTEILKLKAKLYDIEHKGDIE